MNANGLRQENERLSSRIDRHQRHRKRRCVESEKNPIQENNNDKKKLSPAKARKKAEKKAFKKVLKTIALESECSSGSEDDEKQNNERKLSENSRNNSDIELPDELDLTCVTESLSGLEKEISGLRKEIATLHKKLPELIKESISSVLGEQNKENRKVYFSKAVNNACSPKPLLPSPRTLSLSPSPSSSKTSSSTLRKPTWKKMGDNEDNVCEKDTSESSSLQDYIDSVQIAEILRSPSHKKMTANLMTALFERKVLAESSVTGKSKGGRPALDRTKVETIIACVLKKFPDVNDTVIKSTMAQKCKDMRFSFEGKRRKTENNDEPQLQKQ